MEPPQHIKGGSNEVNINEPARKPVDDLKESPRRHSSPNSCARLSGWQMRWERLGRSNVKRPGEQIFQPNGDSSSHASGVDLARSRSRSGRLWYIPLNGIQDHRCNSICLCSWKVRGGHDTEAPNPYVPGISPAMGRGKF